MSRTAPAAATRYVVRSCWLAWLALVGLALAGCSLPQASQRHTYRVSQACSAADRCYASLQAAFDATRQVPAGEWVRVEVGPGSFEEKVTITRPMTLLRGAGTERTFLRFGAVAEHAARYHRDGWGTAGSATLTIEADQVTVEDMTIENTFDYLANDALADDDPRKIKNSQALAAALDKRADRVLMRGVTLLGYQDTLFADAPRAVISQSVIAGNVDFIFGGGSLLILDSIIRTRPRAAVLGPQEMHSFVTAPSTPLSRPIGLVIYRSRLEREAGVPDSSVALGRPWHPTRNFPDGRYADPLAVGQTSFIECYMGAHIHPDHWTSMLGTARDGTKTQVFVPQGARFFEQGSTGPGARREDIGLRWSADRSMAEIAEYFQTDWPAAHGVLATVDATR